jgi:hypothetical protein
LSDAATPAATSASRSRNVRNGCGTPSGAFRAYAGVGEATGRNRHDARRAGAGPQEGSRHGLSAAGAEHDAPRRPSRRGAGEARKHSTSRRWVRAARRIRPSHRVPPACSPPTPPPRPGATGRGSTCRRLPSLPPPHQDHLTHDTDVPYSHIPHQEPSTPTCPHVAADPRCADPDLDGTHLSLFETAPESAMTTPLVAARQARQSGSGTAEERPSCPGGRAGTGAQRPDRGNPPLTCGVTPMSHPL